MKFVNVTDEYNKFPELRSSKGEVLKIKEWIKNQPHLPDLEEREVILFFHACRYHTEITKQTIDLHYTTKTLCPEFFSNIDPFSPEIEQIMEVVSIVHLKKKTPKGHKVIIAKFSDLNPTKFNCTDLLKLYGMCYDLILAQEGAFSGFEIVMDLSGLSLGHIARIGLMAVKKFMFFLQEATAIRIAGLHYVSLVPFMDTVLALTKPFLKEELYNIVHLHSNFDSFYKYVPKEILPADYGGNEEPVEILKEKFYKNMKDNREFFLNEEATRRVNEKLRPGKPKNASDLFGTEGNFKQLLID